MCNYSKITIIILAYINIMSINNNNNIARFFKSTIVVASVILLITHVQLVQSEVFAFGIHEGYQYYNWTRITDIGFWTYPEAEVLELTKRYNVKLWADSGLPDQKEWLDPAKRKQFAQAKLEQVKQYNLTGGVFFDFEGALNKAAEKEAYTALAKEVADALATVGAGIFICVGGRPTYELRDYNYTGLAMYSEFLFIMGYDMHFWDDYTCVTKGTCSPAEASIKDLDAGITAYVKQVPSDKLLLGLPWYGQVYQEIVVPWNKGQIHYADTLDIINTKGRLKSKTLDKSSQTWKVECNGKCRDDKAGGIIWFDDATTLKPKYALAKQYQLRGVGVWQMSDAPLPDSKGNDPYKQERNDMLNALYAWDQ